MSPTPSPFRPCTGCKTPVHARSKTCKGCGLASPWPPKPVLEVKPKARRKAKRKAGRKAAPRAAAAPAPQSRAESAAAVTLEQLSAAPPAPADERPTASSSAPVVETMTRRYVVLRDFATMVGISLSSFQEGQVLDEPALIEKLVADECPIKAMTDDDVTLICPHCKRTFLQAGAEVPEDFSDATKAKLQRLGLA